MRKEMTVKLFTVIILTLFFYSCEKKNVDKKILDSILYQSSFSKSDSLFFNLESDNKKTITFFRYRNSKNIVYKSNTDKNYKKSIQNDSVYFDTSPLLPFEKPITRDAYIKMGKGINEVAETFLKDSFYYGNVIIKNWDLDNKQQAVFKSFFKKKELDISPPVYNLKKDKAIVYKRISEGRFVINTIYLLRKNDSKWETVFKEVDSTYYFN